MSRRRKMREDAPRLTDVPKRRLRFVCTGAGRHAERVQFLREYGQMLRGGVEEAVMATVDAESLRGTRLPSCPRCGRPGGPLPDELLPLLENVVKSAGPGRPLRYDVSTGRLL